jgi:hypothetical protein
MYRCRDCVLEFEELKQLGDGLEFATCGFCGAVADRAYDLERVNIRPDMEPGYNIGLGEYIGSRRELRERLAYHNARAPDLFMNDNPSDGRLTSEERAELEGNSPGIAGTVLEKRRRGDWSSEPDGELTEKDMTGEPFTPIMSKVVTEGKADYQAIRDQIKETHAKGLSDGQRDTWRTGV